MAHFPDSGLDTVNSALFLRFVNPAIVSPQSYNLVQGEIPISVRRGLTFISKVTWLAAAGGGRTMHMHFDMCVCVCVCVCMHACVHVCVRARVCAMCAACA